MSFYEKENDAKKLLFYTFHLVQKISMQLYV